MFKCVLTAFFFGNYGSLHSFVWCLYAHEMFCYKVNIRTMSSVYCNDNEGMKNSVKFKPVSKFVLQVEEPSYYHLKKKKSSLTEI